MYHSTCYTGFTVVLYTIAVYIVKQYAAYGIVYAARLYGNNGVVAALAVTAVGVYG
jgi:hypothetical protein